MKTNNERKSMNILFLCTGNSCRSILAEATFNALAPANMRAMSAGSQPAGYVHPRALALLEHEGISTKGYYSKSWNDLPEIPDVVITVCGNAANEICPAYLGNVIRAHWGVDDPVKATGTEADIDASFNLAYHTLRRRIEAFLALPLSELAADKIKLSKELVCIGKI